MANHVLFKCSSIILTQKSLAIANNVLFNCSYKKITQKIQSGQRIKVLQFIFLSTVPAKN